MKIGFLINRSVAPESFQIVKIRFLTNRSVASENFQIMKIGFLIPDNFQNPVDPAGNE
jgi:hypothetical protein